MPNPDPKPIEVPIGKMRVWDAVQKKVILVDAPAGALDRITLTLRIHDAQEKNDAEKSTSWVTVEVSRDDLKMAKADFIAKYVEPALGQLKILELS